MTRALLRHLASETDKLRQAGLFRPEVAASAPKADTIVFTGTDYLGLGRRPEVEASALAAVKEAGVGLPGSRAFGGTVAMHHALEHKLSVFLNVPAAIAFSSGYLANVGLFDALFDARDYVLVDAAAHPSLADGVRLCGARALPYRSEDLEHLEDRLKRSRTARFRVIVSDGVFPLSGHVAPLKAICDLARRYDALVVVHDPLGVGVLGPRQRGAIELHDVADRVDVLTGSFVDVLGGAVGGYVAGRQEIVAWLRQKSTPYLFGGALTPSNAGAAMAALDVVHGGHAPAEALIARTTALRGLLEARGFEVSGGGHAILTVGVGNAVGLQRMVNALSERGVYVQGMCYPVVPENRARIQLNVTTAHTESVLETAVERMAQAADTLQRP